MTGQERTLPDVLFVSVSKPYPEGGPNAYGGGLGGPGGTEVLKSPTARAMPSTSHYQLGEAWSGI